MEIESLEIQNSDDEVSISIHDLVHLKHLMAQCFTVENSKSVVGCSKFIH